MRSPCACWCWQQTAGFTCIRSLEQSVNLSISCLQADLGAGTASNTACPAIPASSACACCPMPRQASPRYSIGRAGLREQRTSEHAPECRAGSRESGVAWCVAGVGCMRAKRGLKDSSGWRKAAGGRGGEQGSTLGGDGAAAARRGAAASQLPAAARPVGGPAAATSKRCGPITCRACPPSA